MNFANSLSENSSNVENTFAAITNFDRCFATGFANLNGQLSEAIVSLERIFTGTPLSESVQLAVKAISQNEFSVRHFTVLAAARTALQGALFDSLQERSFTALGRKDNKEKESNFTQINSSVLAERESIQHWLMEIAIVGFARLDVSALIPFTGTLEQIQANPEAIDLAGLLTGFYRELIDRIPIKEIDTIPLYRWVDLWSRGMLGQSLLLDNIEVYGTLELFGLDLRHHDNLVCFTIYGLLNSGAEIRAVKVTMSAYKVDAITGDEIWLLFPEADLLLNAFCENKTLAIEKMPMLSTGDLLWDGSKAKIGHSFDLIAKARDFFAVNADKKFLNYQTHPLDRHPVQLAEPIFLEDYKMKKDGEELLLNWTEGSLKIASKRNSILSGLSEKAILSSRKIFGLLRYDAQNWQVQPLAIESKQADLIFAGQKASQTIQKPPKKNTVAILQERASRLLRKS